MYCFNCGKKLSEGSVFCGYCGRKQDKEVLSVEDKSKDSVELLENESNDLIKEVKAEKKLPSWAIVIIILLVIQVFVNMLNGGADWSDDKVVYDDDGHDRFYNEPYIDDTDNSSMNKTYFLGDSFTFNGFEIKTDTNIIFEKHVNISEKEIQYIKVPVVLKNSNNYRKKFNKFLCTYYDPRGYEIRPALKADVLDAIGNADEMEVNATRNLYFYIPYSGDGRYSITFDDPNLSITTTLYINVNR